MLTSNATEWVIPIPQNLQEVLPFFEAPETIVLKAVRRYLLDICWQKIELAEQQMAVYEQRYGMNYLTFNQRVTTHENFLERLNQTHPLWEADAIEWFYRQEELQIWRSRLEKVLNGFYPSRLRN